MAGDLNVTGLFALLLSENKRCLLFDNGLLSVLGRFLIIRKPSSSI